MDNIKIALLIGIVLYLVYLIYQSKKIKENFEIADLYQDIQIVISRYNENIDWIFKHPFNKFKIICYNKGPKLDISTFERKNIIIHNIPNVGRCDHTFLYHIIQNYSNLANITIFLPGSCLDPIKKDKTEFVINKTLETSNSVFQGRKFNNILTDIYDFELDAYICSNTSNAELNPEHKLQPSPIRPFGKWYQHNFGNIRTTIVPFFSIFSIHKSHILSHRKNYYQNLLSYLDTHSNPEAGHYFERAWTAVFYPIEDKCFYYN